MRWPGSRRTVADLVEAHSADLYRYAFRLSGSREEAEDLTQEAFCQAHQKLDQLRDWDRARGWLFRILRNVYLHKLRAGKHTQHLSLELAAEVPDRTPEPMPEVEPARLQEALNELPEAFRTPLILFYFEEFSYREIAEQMDVPLGTVMSRLARGKAFLRGRLAPAPLAGVPRPGEVS